MPRKIINFSIPFLKKIIVIIVGIFCFVSIQSAAQTISSQDSIKNTTYELRKQERERIRDSIANESRKAAAARKAYKKSLKKKKRKKKKTEVITKKNNPIKKDTLRKKRREKKITKQRKARQDSIFKATRKENRATKRKARSKKVSIYKDEYVGTNYVVREIIREPPTRKKTYFAFQFGPSNYLGDLGGNSRLDNPLLGDLSFKTNTFFYGFSLTHLRKEAIGLRLSYVFGEIAGSDKNTYFRNTTDPSYLRFVRNLDFRTKINEGSLMLEIHPFKFFSYKKSLHNSYFQPYALFGIGRYSFNPQGSFFDPILEESVWVDLQPLSLEGQGMPEFPDREVYKLSQWNIPYGFGFNYEISPTVSLGLEYVGRTLFTDYLDDVSTSFIDPTLYDKYLQPENAALAKILNNKSKNIDAARAYTPGEKRGGTNNDFYFSFNARLIIKISKDRRKRKDKQIFKYDDHEICE